MEHSRRPVYPGIVLILLGLIFLASNITGFRLGKLWPLVMLIPAVFFFVQYFRDKKNFGVLMPGTILLVIGLLFQYCELTGWEAMQDLWPLFLLAPGLGFIVMYYFGKRETGFLIPGVLLIAASAAFFTFAYESDYFWPVVFIALGLLVLLKRRP